MHRPVGGHLCGGHGAAVGDGFVVKRLPSGQRYFDDSDVGKALLPDFDESRRRTIIYCGVSSPGQRNDLVSQVAAVKQFCEKTLKDGLTGGGR